MEPAPTPRVVISAKEADELCEELLAQPLVATDSEWYNNELKRHPHNNGLTACWTFCYRDAAKELQSIYMHNYGEAAGNVHRLKPYWTAKNRLKILHNAPVDWHMLSNHGIRGENFRYDTMVMDFLIDENRENRHGLKECAQDHLGHTRLSYKETFGTVKLKQNGEPYANGALEVENMNVIASDPSLFPVLVDYASDDAYDTWLLYELFRAKLEAIPWRKTRTYWDYYVEVESEITEIIIRMEHRGMPLDLPFLLLIKGIAEKFRDELEIKIIEHVGVPLNPGSPPQKKAFLHGPAREVKKGKKVLFTVPTEELPVQAWTNGGKSGNVQPQLQPAEMKALQHLCYMDGRKDLAACIGWWVDYSATKTQIGTFFKGLSAKATKGHIHTRINQIGTVSGRMSSAGPNLQNITAGKKDRFGLRDCFVAPEGHCLIVADYGQLEYRLLAHFTQDPKLIAAFLKGHDLHSLTAYNVFPEVKEAVDFKYGEGWEEALKGDPNYIAANFEFPRKDSKLLNFEIIYGVGPKKLAQQLKIHKDDAWNMIQGWFRGYNYVKPWMNKIVATAKEQGHVKTLIGRYRRPNMRKILSRDRRLSGSEERSITNGVIQGSAADVCERAMILLDRDEELREYNAVMIMQVHDEIILTCPIRHRKAAAKRVKFLMEHPFTRELRVPLPVSVGIGMTWECAKV